MYQGHMVKINQKVQLVIGLLIILLMAEGGFTAMRLMSIGSYITGYEGAKARFLGVQYGGKVTRTGDTTIFWDPDSMSSGLPPISGEETAVFIPSESVGKQTSTFARSGADIKEWLLKSTTIKNPVNSYEWSNDIGGNVTAFYRMEEWQLKWFFSISSEPSGSEIPAVSVPSHITDRKSIRDAKVWFEIDIAPMWYFADQSMSYFAIAEMRISDLQMGGKLTGKNPAGAIIKSGEYEAKANSESRVAPQSANSILPIYLNAFGSEQDRAETTAYSYQGKVLNPTLFRDSVYTYFTLDDFGVNAWFDYGYWWKADVVTVAVDVHVFVVGEWKVQDIQNIPDSYGRTAKVGGSGLGESWFLNTSQGRLLLVGIVALVFLFIAAMFFPWVIILIMQLLGQRRRR